MLTIPLERARAARLWRTFRSYQRDDLSIVARGIAFSAALGVFPALAALAGVFGLVADPAAVRRILPLLSGVLPADSLALLDHELQRLAAAADGANAFAVAFGLAAAVWSAAGGVKSLIRGLNIAYGAAETRRFWRLTGLAVGFVLAGFATFIVAVGAVVLAPVALALAPPTMRLEGVAQLRWPLMFGVAWAALAAAYRFGPCGAPQRWRDVRPGAAVAAGLWIAASWAFSLYVARFADMGAAYGSTAALFAFLTWVWLSAAVALFGARLNAEWSADGARDQPASKIGGAPTS